METKIVKKTDQELVGNSPAEMIRMAVEGKADLDKLEKLLAIQERWEANEARKAYHEAMAAFKKNPPKIEKDKKVGYDAKTGGRVGYTHASLANVVEKITKSLSEHGLSASWRTQQNGKIVVTCRITHVNGHSEETTLSADADSTGSKNSIQAIGSTITYLERYTLLASLGLATHDMHDDDGARSNDNPLTEAQIITLKEYVMQYSVDEAKFLKFLKVNTFEEIMQSQFNKAVSALQQKAKNGGAK